MRRFIFANRTAEARPSSQRASAARRWRLEISASAIARAEVVVSSTSAPEFVVHAADVMPGARVFVDLAVPRDIDPEIGQIEGASVINIDELEEAVRRNIALRESEYGPARAIALEQAGEFRRWLGELEVVPAITSLRALAEQIRVGRAGARRGPLGGPHRGRPRAARRGHALDARKAPAPPHRAAQAGSRRQ